MQTITITGWASRDAETRTTQKGDQVTAINVPVKQGWGENEQTNWFRVNIWGKRAEFAGKIVKGDFLAVTGELTIGEYNGKPQYEIRANDFQTVRGGGGGERPQRQQRRDNDGWSGKAPADDGWGDDSESVPF